MQMRADFEINLSQTQAGLFDYFQRTRMGMDEGGSIQ